MFVGLACSQFPTGVRRLVPRLVPRAKGCLDEIVLAWVRAVVALRCPGLRRGPADAGRLVALPADQFDRGRTNPRRLAALKAKLAEHVGDAPAVSDEELADEIISRRQQS